MGGGELLSPNLPKLKGGKAASNFSPGGKFFFVGNSNRTFCFASVEKSSRRKRPSTFFSVDDFRFVANPLNELKGRVVSRNLLITSRHLL